MVSATLRGAFGLKTKQQLTQAEIRSILESTEGELQKVWVDIQVLERDAPQTSAVQEDIKNLVQNYRDYANYCIEMSTINDEVTVKSDLSVLKASRKMAQELRGNASTLRKDVANTSKRIHGVSSRMEINVVDVRNVASGATTDRDSNGSAVSGGFSDVFQTFVKMCIPAKKRNINGFHYHASSNTTSQQPLNATDPLRTSSDTQIDSNSSVDESTVDMQEGNTYRIVLGCETSTGQIVMTGENQGEAENSQWLGTALGAIQDGRVVESQMAESQMHTILQKVNRRTSTSNISLDNMSLDSVYVDATDGLAEEELT